MTNKNKSQLQQDETSLTKAEQADRKAWDDALASPASEALLKSLVAKGMNGKFDADQAGASWERKET
ncbi:hypothetical protein D3C75_1078330 [compost metagenome]